jgi:Phospholipase_D-nuclease N-terminal
MLTATTAWLADDSGNTITTIFFGAVTGIFWIIQLVLWIAAVISILTNVRLTGGGKFLWIVVAFTCPFLGPLGWFFFGRNAKLVKD